MFKMNHLLADQHIIGDSLDPDTHWMTKVKHLHRPNARVTCLTRREEHCVRSLTLMLPTPEIDGDGSRPRDGYTKPSFYIESI